MLSSDGGRRLKELRLRGKVQREVGGSNYENSFREFHSEDNRNGVVAGGNVRSGKVTLR